MLLSPHVEEAELQETIDWYLQNFEHVSKVYCGSDLGEGCGELLALEVSGGPGHQVDERGVARITIGSTLLSTRVRLDEHDSGRMVGYQCSCGNDTRLSDAERHHKPVNGWHHDLRPHEAAQIHSAIKLCGKHKAKFKDDGTTKHYESFRHEVIK